MSLFTDIPCIEHRWEKFKYPKGQKNWGKPSDTWALQKCAACGELGRYICEHYWVYRDEYYDCFDCKLAVHRDDFHAWRKATRFQDNG